MQLGVFGFCDVRHERVLWLTNRFLDHSSRHISGTMIVSCVPDGLVPVFLWTLQKVIDDLAQWIFRASSLPRFREDASKAHIGENVWQAHISVQTPEQVAQTLRC